MIRLCRNETLKKKNTDDLIYIYRCGGNIHVKHVDKSHPAKRVITRTVLTQTSLTSYISTLAKMVRDDCDPFVGIQLNFPGFPVVFYSTARLHNPDVMRTIKEAAYITSDYWFHEYANYLSDDASSVSSDSSSSTETLPY
jgi:hypothetical protein